MELLGADVDVAGKNVVGDDILDEGRLVVLLFIIGFGAVERHLCHCADRLRHVVVTVYKHSVVEAAVKAGQRPDRLAGQMGNLILGQGNNPRQLRQLGADLFRIGTGHHGSLCVNHAKVAVGRGFQPQNYVCKNVICHNLALLSVC